MKKICLLLASFCIASSFVFAGKDFDPRVLGTKFDVMPLGEGVLCGRVDQDDIYAVTPTLAFWKTGDDDYRNLKKVGDFYVLSDKKEDLDKGKIKYETHDKVKRVYAAHEKHFNGKRRDTLKGACQLFGPFAAITAAFFLYASYSGKQIKKQEKELSRLLDIYVAMVREMKEAGNPFFKNTEFVSDNHAVNKASFLQWLAIHRRPVTKNHAEGLSPEFVALMKKYVKAYDSSLAWDTQRASARLFGYLSGFVAFIAGIIATGIVQDAYRENSQFYKEKARFDALPIPTDIDLA